MKILLFTHYYEPELGAPQRRWSGFISRWQKAGHQVTVYCPTPHYPDWRSSAVQRTKDVKPWKQHQGKYGETIHRMPYIRHGYSGGVRLGDQFFTAGISLVASLLREKNNDFDVVISTVPGLPSAYAAQIFSALRGIPHVLDLRDAWPDILVGEAQDTSDYSLLEKGKATLNAWAARGLAKAVRRVQRKANTVVTTTYSFKRILEKRQIQHVETITNGADPQIGLEVADQPHDKFETLRILYLGTIGRSQGLRVLLRALLELKERSLAERVEVRFVGEGADLPYLKQYAEKNNLKVEFLSPVSKEQLFQAYTWADVHLVSLRKAKVFEWTVPSKIFELIATRRRIIALVDGEAARVIYRTRSGIVLTPGDSMGLADEIEKMLHNHWRTLVNDQAMNILKTEYNYDVLAPRYLKVLQESITRFRNQ